MKSNTLMMASKMQKNKSAFIPYGKQSIDADDIAAVTAVLESDFLTQGPTIPAFEKAFCQYTGATYSVAVANATAALHIACLALGVGKGDDVWTSPNSFLSSANCALFCGANIDFVDIDPHTYNLCSDALEKKLQQAKSHNKLPKVVIPVHFAGQPCDMASIHALSLEYGFAIIEDASHAVGASYQEKKVGSCQFSDICIFSFHPVKIITSAEGGLAFTNSELLADKMRKFACHGTTRHPDELINQQEGAWYYEQQSLGYNYRMTELQAALGLSQLSKLDQFITTRHALFENYSSILAHLDIHLPTLNKGSISALHLYPICLSDELTPYRKAIFQTLRDKGIGVQVHYIPIHTQPYYQNLGFAWGDFPKAERYYQSCISLPLYASLSHDQQNQVRDVLEGVLAEYKSLGSDHD